MKGLSIAGTAAMFLVGGGILVHGIPGLEHAVHGLVGDSGPVAAIAPTLVNALVGIVAGGVAVAILVGVKKVLPAKKA